MVRKCLLLCARQPQILVLYFVGLIQPVGALPPLAEAQSRWVAQLIDGAPLPTVAQMRAEIDRNTQELADRYQQRPRHTIQVDYWGYLEDMRSEHETNEAVLSAPATTAYSDSPPSSLAPRCGTKMVFTFAAPGSTRATP